MPRQYFLPRKEADKELWLLNFAQKLPQYAEKYSISAEDIADMQQGAAAFSYWRQHYIACEKYLMKLTAYKKELYGGSADAVSELPVPPALPEPHVLATPGVFTRAASLAGVIKKKYIYAEADGHDLGLVGAEMKRDIQLMKPMISVRLSAGGHPEIVWHKNDMDGLDIYKDDGSSNWLLLAFDIHPNYKDMSPLPPMGQSITWRYKCIYRHKDEQVGIWSDEVKITVSGE